VNECEKPPDSPRKKAAERLLRGLFASLAVRLFRREVLIDLADECVGIDSVHRASLLNALAMRHRAAKAMHARVHENIGGAFVQLNYLLNEHIFCCLHEFVLQND
jgi:hypothetical protein